MAKKYNPPLLFTLRELGDFLRNADACIREVDVPMILESILIDKNMTIPPWLKRAIRKSNKRLDSGDY